MVEDYVLLNFLEYMALGEYFLLLPLYQDFLLNLHLNLQLVLLFYLAQDWGHHL